MWALEAAGSSQEDPVSNPPLDLGLVNSFVLNAHSDLVKTRDLLDEDPRLINSSWDWGGGDWETALGAASHMGRKDIATFLLSRGSRLDLFCAAMMGMSKVISAAIEVDARVVEVPGPHGISLLDHAVKGGDEFVIKMIEEAGR